MRPRLYLLWLFGRFQRLPGCLGHLPRRRLFPAHPHLVPARSKGDQVGSILQGQIWVLLQRVSASQSCCGFDADISVSIAWFLLAIPLLSFPTGLPVTAVGMNCESR